MSTELVIVEDCGDCPSSPFDAIRHIDHKPDGSASEWWSAREAMAPLGYRNWQNLERVIHKARSACRNSGENPADHFTDASKTPAHGGPRQADTMLSRFGMYLLAINCDPDKPEIAAAQRYFVVQTRRAELLLPTPETAAGRPWFARFCESYEEHRGNVTELFGAGAFTVVTEGLGMYLSLEKQMVRHRMAVRPTDRPDVSLGRRYAIHRRLRGMDPPLGRVPIWLPDQGRYESVEVYAAEESGYFREWLNATYLRVNLLQYLDAKPELHEYGGLPRASVADHTCLALAKCHADLDRHTRLCLQTTNGGFVPVGTLKQPLRLPRAKKDRKTPSLFDDAEAHR